MGNAFGALGGDFTSLSINPAGAAVYRSGEFVLTPSIGKISIDGTYLGNTENESKYNLSIDNLGYVATVPTGENSESGLVSLSFGIGFNRLANFSRDMLLKGENANHSLMSYFTETANNQGVSSDYLDDYYEKLAWNTYMLDYDSNNDEYFNELTDHNYGQSQRKTTSQRGFINEYTLSFAANFNHKFYLGTTIGIHDVVFKENASLLEYDAQDNIPNFDEYTFGTYLKTTGTGYNIKVGAIYKPTDNLRLGLAVHSQTFYQLNDLYDSNMSSIITWASDGITEQYSDQPDKQGVYDYELETPLKAILSGAYVIGKSGLISIDYEIVDYSTSKLKNGSDNYKFYDENKDIKDAYKTVGNLHIGGEYRVNRNFSLRGGYENYPSVYKSSSNQNSKVSYSTISGGFGFKQGNVFFDGTIKRSMNDEYLKPYQGAISMAKYTTNQNQVILTLGFKF
jgi:hypothetical protein